LGTSISGERSGLAWRSSLKHSYGAGPPIRRERRREEAGGVELRRKQWSAYM
jgi:hypothetical protein